MSQKHFYLLSLVDLPMSSLPNLVPNEQHLGINKQLPLDPGRRRHGIRAPSGRRRIRTPCRRHRIISRDLAGPRPPELVAATAAAVPAPVAAAAHRVWPHAARRSSSRRGGGNDVVGVSELAGQPRH